MEEQEVEETEETTDLQGTEKSTRKEKWIQNVKNVDWGALLLVLSTAYLILAYIVYTLLHIWMVIITLMIQGSMSLIQILQFNCLLLVPVILLSIRSHKYKETTKANRKITIAIVMGYIVYSVFMSMMYP